MRPSWQENAGSLEEISSILAEHPAETIGFRGLPNGRLQIDLHGVEVLETVGEQARMEELRGQLLSAPVGIDPEDLWELGEKLGREAVVLPDRNGSLSTFDVVFKPVQAADETSFVAWEGTADRPVAAYVSQPFFEEKEKPLVADLRGFLEASLPDYMVPSFFEVLPALPKTPNGKINRKALPRPSGQSSTADKPYVAPRNAVEAKLAEVWQQVLGREKVGINDNIFEIGGDSLLIFQITARANQAGLPFAVRQVFQLRTIAELAATLDPNALTPSNATPSAATNAAAPIARVSRDAFRRPKADAPTS